MKVVITKTVQEEAEVDLLDLVPLKQAADALGLSINGLKGRIASRRLRVVTNAGKLHSFSDRAYLFREDVKKLEE